MRRLVPDRNEVANLMDEISTRAKIRGVMVSQFQPLPVEAGPAPFETYKYQYSVIGRFDQLGEFLSDVASLQRIIVPMDLVARSGGHGQGQGPGRQLRGAARGPLPDPDVREDHELGGTVQWHLTRPPGSFSWPCW